MYKFVQSINQTIEQAKIVRVRSS